MQVDLPRGAWLGRFQEVCSGRAQYRPWTSTSGAGPGRYLKSRSAAAHAGGRV